MSLSPPASCTSPRIRGGGLPAGSSCRSSASLSALGNAGLIAVDIPLVQEFVPAYKRGWVSGLTTTLLPAGNILGALSGAFLAPLIGWRGLFLVGLTPALLVLMIRYWVPESPRWLMRMGRHEEASKSLAWALQCDPREIDLPTIPPEVEKTSWREL